MLIKKWKPYVSSEEKKRDLWYLFDIGTAELHTKTHNEDLVIVQQL